MCFVLQMWKSLKSFLLKGSTLIIIIKKNLSSSGVETVPMMTSLQTSGDAVCLLSALHKAASKLDIRKHHQFLETGMELDDYHEVLENINTLLKCYQWLWLKIICDWQDLCVVTSCNEQQDTFHKWYEKYMQHFWIKYANHM